MTSDDSSKKPVQLNKGGRPSKAQLFEKERKELLNKLLNYIGITDTVKVFYIEDIDANQDTQTKIEALSEDVKKYFNFGNWPFFCKQIDQKVRWLSLTKSILKAMNVKIKRGHIKNSFEKKIVKTGYVLEI